MPVSFGVVLEVNQQVVTLRPKDVTEAAEHLKANGVEVELPHPVSLGTLADGKAGLEKLIDNFTEPGDTFTLPAASEFPEELREVAEFAGTIEIVIEEFYLRIPGTVGTEANESTEFTFGASAIAPKAFTPAGLPVGLKGLFVRATNQKPTAVAAGDVA